jgi:hypothetical protein
MVIYACIGLSCGILVIFDLKKIEDGKARMKKIDRRLEGVYSIRRIIGMFVSI